MPSSRLAVSLAAVALGSLAASRAVADSNSAPPSSSPAETTVERLHQLRYHTQGVTPIGYELPHDAAVTLVVERPDGARVRNLISDFPRRAGRNADFWDGADDFGRLVAPGEYRVRGLYRGELDVLFQFAYGTPANPPWESSDGRGAWWADHVPPMAVAADEQRIYVATSFSEGGNTLMGLDYQGQKQWGLARINGGMLARQGKYLYMLAGGEHHGWDAYLGQLRLLRIDPAVGKLAPWPDGKSEHVIAVFPADRKLSPREPEGVCVARGLYDARWLHHEALGLAAAEARLFVSMLYENKILVIDPERGEKVGEFPLDQPVGLAADRQGQLYAVSGRKVVRLDARGGVTPVVTAGLKAPAGLAVGSRGEVFVCDWGDQMCVKVFSPRGSLLRTIGTPGGRPLVGRYDPRGMFRPLSVALDAQDRLWAAEYDYAPKRLSVWSAAGKFLTEFCGATFYAGTSSNVNTLNPHLALSMGNILELDWQRGLWRVAATLWRPTEPRALLGPRGEGMFYQVVRWQGRELLIASCQGFLCVSELLADRARPLAALGQVSAAFLPEGGREGRIPDLVARRLWDDPRDLDWAKAAYRGLFDGTMAVHPHRAFSEMEQRARWQRKKPLRSQFLWTDRDGDGLVQDDEIRFYTEEEAGNVILGCTWRFPIGPDLTLYPVANWSPRPKGIVGPSGIDKQTYIWRLPVKAWNQAGAPLYDLADARRIVAQRPPLFYSTASWVDSRGDILLLNEDPLTMYSSQGRLLWSYRNRWPGVHGSHAAPKDSRGLLIGPLKVVGSVDVPGLGELCCASGNMGKAFLMTTDGLYVGSLFRDCRSAPDSLPDRPQRGASIIRTSPGSEWFGGEFFRNAEDGRVYLGSAAREGVLLSEVTGLESIRRLPSQTVRFSQADYAQATELLAKRSAEQALTHAISIVAAKNRLACPPAESDFRWTAANSARWQYDASRAAEAAWTFDQRQLAICFREVLDSTPMINGGKLPDTLFKSGDAAIFELRTRPDDERPQIVEGDLRLLLSVFQGRPIAVLYRYKVAGAKEPRRFSSPVTDTVIDQIKVLDSVRVAVDRRGDRYAVRAAIPLAELGFQPQAGHRYRGDFGIIYSDRLGQIDELRMYWSNQATGLVRDLAIEAQIEPRHWGQFEIKGTEP